MSAFDIFSTFLKKAYGVSLNKSRPDPKSSCKYCQWGAPHSGPAHQANMRKGGVGSGRHPKFGTPPSLRTAIGEYERERTPSAHSRMVEAYRSYEAREKKKPSEFDPERVPWEKVKHPWD